jgi:ferredoxin-thioredoxin reductase catalytic subunit
MAETESGADLEAMRLEIRERIKRHVAQSSCRLNPDARVVDGLIEGLIRRKLKFGDYYCPCRVVSGNADIDRANVCPCQTHEAEIAETGHCHCNLFVGPKQP